MHNTPWRTIDSQEDLDSLDRAVYLEDSCTIEFYGSSRNEAYFPTDVSRSGHDHHNIHMLCKPSSAEDVYFEMVLIDCDRYSASFLERPYLQGRVDSLKRVDVRDGGSSTVMRCSRLIYRFVENVRAGSYYRRES